MTPTEVVYTLLELAQRLIGYDADEITQGPLTEGYQDEERIDDALRKMAKVSPRLATELYLIYYQAKRSRVEVQTELRADIDEFGNVTEDPISPFADEDEGEKEVYAMPWRNSWIEATLEEDAELLASTLISFQSYEQDPRVFVRDYQQNKSDAHRYAMLLGGR